MTNSTLTKTVNSIQVANLSHNERFTAPLDAYEDLESTTRLSLYGKAKIIRGFSFLALTSYMKPIMVVDDDGNITVDAQYHEYTVTTKRHEREFLKHVLSIGYLKSDIKRDDDNPDMDEADREYDTALTKEANRILNEIDKKI